MMEAKWVVVVAQCRVVAQSGAIVAQCVKVPNY